MKQVISKTPESQTVEVGDCDGEHEYGIITREKTRVGVVIKTVDAATPTFVAISLGKRSSGDNFIDQNRLLGFENCVSIQEILNRALEVGHEVYTFDTTLELLEWAAQKQKEINNIS